MRRYHFYIFYAFLLLFLASCSITGYFDYPADESDFIKAYFCPQSNCSGMIAKEIMKANFSVYCAFYEVNLDNVINALKEKSKKADVRLFTDNNYPVKLPFARTDERTGLMHNKFCVIDEKRVITGSCNPTFSGLDNQNNLIIAESKVLARNYLDEFREFEHGYFGKGNRVKHKEITINNTKVRNYFCPEDWCTDKVLKTVNQASESVHFMIFSFTDDSLGDLLVKKHNDGVEVKGLLDNFQNKGSQYSEYKKLVDKGINVSLYGNSREFLHNKVIIVDSEIVITGSYNPTRNGDRVNDENILIIYDEKVAEEYEDKLRDLLK